MAHSYTMLFAPRASAPRAFSSEHVLGARSPAARRSKGADGRHNDLWTCITGRRIRYAEFLSTCIVLAGQLTDAENRSLRSVLLASRPVSVAPGGPAALDGETAAVVSRRPVLGRGGI